jgi:predicted HAD superfamily Cof-like phosphohydrolase
VSGDWVKDVLDFHNKFGCYSNAEPQGIPHEVEELRWRLITEELNELAGGMFDTSDLSEIADAITDLIYVLIGTAIAYGIDLRPVWDAVQAANMAKTGGGTRGDGKILKPPGWTAPDIDKILDEQGRMEVEGE